MDTGRIGERTRTLVHRPLYRLGGLYAVPAPDTVLHELATGQPASIQIDQRIIDIPTPRLPVEIVNGHPMVLMGPPWSILDDYLAASEPERYQVRRQLETFLRAAARRLLQEANHMALPGVMTYALGVTFVPKGEVWVGTRGITTDLKEQGIAIRWPIASSNPLQVRIRTHQGWGALMNDEDLAIDRQGDSDGDLVFVVGLEGPPAERVQVQPELDQIIDLDRMNEPYEFPAVEQMDVQTLANGYAAKSLVGLATWYTWVQARYHEDWAKAYDAYLPAIEAMMDGRKTGERPELDQFGLTENLPELQTLIRMALPGVRAMVAARSRPPGFDRDWRDLLRDYWSLRWAPEGVDIEPEEESQDDNVRCDEDTL